MNNSSINNVPDVYVTSPNRSDSYGLAKGFFTEFKEDIRFNSCSQIEFKVAKRICDPLTGKWIDNPMYDYLEKDNLLYVVDDNKYFSYPNRTLRNDYGIKSKSNIANNVGRSEATGSTTYENPKGSILTGFAVQPETNLYNISVASGYNWYNLSDISDFGYDRKPSNWSGGYYQCSCPNFVPINPYDVIMVKTKTNSTYSSSGVRYYKYTILFYSDNNANTLLAEMNIYSGHQQDGSGTESHSLIAKPVMRFSINSLTTDDDIYFYDSITGGSTSIKLSQFKKKMKNGGYIRVCIQDTRAPNNMSLSNKRQYSSFYHSENGTTTIGWSFPYDGWLTIFSGQRYCSQVDNDITDGNYELPLHWFVITDTQDDDSDHQRTKTVTAFSYEYTISNRTISLSEDTCPLYIPPQITNTVNSDNWIIDKVYGNAGSTARTGKQYMTDGLLNQVLKILPDWKIGHVSSLLMARYRKIDDVDNTNLYSFLMNDIQKTYQCYFVFDNDNKKISVYSQDDIVKNSNIILNWQNAIKDLKISNVDLNVMTALRVHTADDLYSVGLVNPTGDNIIYNFNGVLDKLDFVADTSNNDPKSRNKITENGITRNRTLKEAVLKYMEFYNTPNTTTSMYSPAIASICTYIGNGDDDPNRYTSTQFPITSVSDYIEITKKFVVANLKCIEAKSSVELNKSEYLSVLNKIQVQAEFKMSQNNTTIDYYNQEYVQPPSYLEQVYSLGSDSRRQFVSEALYIELVNASKTYYESCAEYEAQLNDYNAYLHVIKNTAMYLNLDYERQKFLTENCSQYGIYVGEDGRSVFLSLLTPAEILALQPFIREGDWTNENSVFSDDYDANDIITTLTDVYSQAKSDMDLFISKPDYDFESEVINWTQLSEMENSLQQLKVGQTISINTHGDLFINPILLEYHINYKDKSDFKMTFTTSYKRKPLLFRFADLYSMISQTSITSNSFNFEE